MSEWSKSTYHIQAEIILSPKCSCDECHQTFAHPAMTFNLIDGRLICSECSNSKKN